MHAIGAFVVSLLLTVTSGPFVAGSPLKPVPVQTSLGAQKNLDIQIPEGATSVSADTINNLAIVIAETVYIMSDGSVQPENPGTTLVPPPFTTTTTVSSGNPATPVITPPPFPGRK